MNTAHTYRIGDLVQTEYNDGPGAGTVYGLITSAGPKQCGVTWESGRRQILHKDRWHLVKRVPDDAREDALHATRHARAALLAKLTAKHEAQLRQRGELNGYAVEIEPGGTVHLTRVKS